MGAPSGVEWMKRAIMAKRAATGHPQLRVAQVTESAPMLSTLRRTAPWWLAALLLAGGGAALQVRDALATMREAHDTDARIAHRLLSQAAVQHEAILATLALLQPAGDADARSEDRLPSVYPQLLAVLRRDAGQAWSDPALQAAEARSQAQHQAVLAAVDAAAAQATVLLAAEPRSYALRLDLRRLVPEAEWPVPHDGPVRAVLWHDGQAVVLQPGSDAAAALGHFRSAKHLSAVSQPFDFQMSRPWGWADLPWGRLGAWLALVAAGLGLSAAWWRQRQARHRAEGLLRLGQVARLNTLGELAAGMAHELNQPLTAVLANTQAATRLLGDDPPDLPLAHQAMAQAVAQARRASEVVGRLRRTVERPNQREATGPVVLQDLLRAALHLLEPELARRGVQVQLDAGDSPVSVRADVVALEQIVHNLLLNALQALDGVPAPERHLWLTLRQEGAVGVLSVRDNGPGIDPAVLPRVFEPFFSTREGGLGLGLSLSESLAQGMGGGLVAAPAAPRGAVFQLSLPLAA